MSESYLAEKLHRELFSWTYLSHTLSLREYRLLVDHVYSEDKNYGVIHWKDYIQISTDPVSVCYIDESNYSNSQVKLELKYTRDFDLQKFVTDVVECSEAYDEKRSGNYILDLFDYISTPKNLF